MEIFQKKMKPTTFEGRFIGENFEVPYFLVIECDTYETIFNWLFDFSNLNKHRDSCKSIEIAMELSRNNSIYAPPVESFYPSEKDFYDLAFGKNVAMISAQSYDQGVKWEYKIPSDNGENTFSTVQKVKWSVTDLMIMFIVKLLLINEPSCDDEIDSRYVTFLLPLKSKVSMPEINILRIESGDENDIENSYDRLIDVMFQSLGSHVRPSSHYPDNSLKGTRELKVFTCLDPGGNPHFNTSFRFIDAKGFTFEPKDKTSMKKLQKILEGLPEGTLETKCLESPQNIAHKPKFAIITCDARSLVYLSYEPNWISSWLFNPSYSLRESILDKMIELKNKIDETLGQDRTVFIFTNIDEVSPSNQSLLMQKLVEKNISPNVVFYAEKDKSKCTQTCKDYCDHWTKETLNGLIQMLCNFKVTSQDH